MLLLIIAQIYSGPSGKFDVHVDTRRGADNIGSLVVWLPCSHTGMFLWYHSVLTGNLADGCHRWLVAVVAQR